MRGAVIDQRQGDAPGRDLAAVDLHARDAAGDAVRVFDAHLVARAVIAERDREARPAARDAWVDEQRGAAEAKAQEPFDPRAIHPTGGAGVPGPAAAARMGRLRIDVTGHDVRLDPITIESGTRARVIDRVQEREELAGPVAVAERGERHDRPDGPVRVLPAVLAHARRIALHVARIP